MARRGRAASPGLTDAQIATILAMFNNGDTQRFIALQLGLTEQVIKDILRKHKVAKNVAPVISSQQEEGLAKYLTKQNNLRGGFPALREAVEKWAQDHNCSFAFSFSWRRNFLKRHQSRLPENIKKLLATRPRDETMDSNETEAEEEMVDEEPAEADLNVEWRIVNEEPEQQTIVAHVEYQPIPAVQEPQLSEEEKAELAEAVEMAMRAFDRAGVPDIRAKNLLRNMSVPGFGQPDAPRKIGPRKTKPRPRWPMIMPVTQEPLSKTPVKKTPLQLRVLEREYTKNQHLSGAPAEALARKLNLSLESVLSWYRNRRQKRAPKKK